MNTIYATLVPARRTRSGEFTCARCGWLGTYNSKRGRPVYCRDCRELRGVA
jgi:hypothetical protein